MNVLSEHVGVSICGKSMKIDYCYTVPLNMALSDSSEGKFSQWAESEVGYLIIHFLWKEKWPMVRIYVDS